MASYIPPLDDMGFLLKDVFGFDALMTTLPGHEGIDAEVAVSILEQGGRFCAEILEPLNRTADEEGCRLADGVVTTAEGMADAYRAFVEAGGPALSAVPGFGGQGLPRVLQLLLDEMLSSANLSFRPVCRPDAWRGGGHRPPRRRRIEGAISAEDGVG